MKKLWMEDRIIRIIFLIFILKSHLCDEMDVKEQSIVQKLRNGDQGAYRYLYDVIMWYYVNLRMSWLAIHF